MRHHPKSCTLATALRMLWTTWSALRRGDIHSGFILLEFYNDSSITAQASLEYRSSWKGKDQIFEYGEWRNEMEGTEDIFDV